MVTKSLIVQKSKFLILCALFLSDILLFAQAENKFIRRGNKAFDRGDYKEAEIDYQKVLEKNNKSDIGEFNLGGALFQQENYKEAASLFENQTEKSVPDEQRAKSFHNLGNSLVNLKQFDKAVEAYKNALRLNPTDEDTKYNLLYAQKMLQQQRQQQQQNQDQNQNQEQNQNQQQNQDQAQNQEQQQEEKNQQQQQNQQPDQQQDAQQQQAQAQPRQISKEDAERMLQALQERERKTMEKLKMEEFKNAKKVKTEKDW